MATTIRLCYFLQVFIFFCKIRPNQGILRMRWEDRIDHGEQLYDLTREAIINTGAFNKDYTKDNVIILQEAKLVDNPGKVLLTCKILNNTGKVEQQIYAAGTEENDPVSRDGTQDALIKIHIHSVGDSSNIAHIVPSGTNDIIRLKQGAEHYPATHFAFQPIYESAEDRKGYDRYEKDTGRLRSFTLCDIDAKKVKQLGLMIHRYWIRVQSKEMVVIYTNANRNMGAYAIITANTAGGIPIVNKFQVVETLVKTFEAVSECLNSELVFETGWNTNPVEIQKLSNPLADKLKAQVPWLSSKTNIALYAIDNSSYGFLGAIFLTSGSYQRNTFFAIWNGVHFEQLAHVSFAGTMGDTLLSYQSYSRIPGSLVYQDYDNGVGWKTIESDSRNKYESSILNAVNNLRKYVTNKFHLVRKYGLLPNTENELYDSVLNFCVILLSSKAHAAVLIKLKIDQSTKITPEAVIVQNSTFIDKDFLQSAKENVLQTAITKMVQARYLISKTWESGLPAGFDISTITSSLFLSLTLLKPVAKFYSASGTRLLVIIIDASIASNNENARLCFVALNKFDGVTYSVTFVGDLISNLNEEDGIFKAKLQAEAHDNNAALAYQPHWMDCRGDEQTITIDGHVAQLIYTWKIHEEDEYSNEIRLYGAISGENYSEFCYKPTFWSPYIAKYVFGQFGNWEASVHQVLNELDTKFNNTFFFSERFSEPKETDNRLPKSKIEELVSRVAIMYDKKWKIDFKESIFPASIRTRGVLVLRQKRLEVQNLQANEPGRSNARHTLDEPCTILLPIEIVMGCFSRTGEIIEIKGQKYEIEAAQALLDCFAITASRWITPETGFSQAETELIFDCAPWETNLKTINKIKERILGDNAQGKQISVVCSLNSHESNFVVFYTWIENSEIMNVTYVSGLGGDSSVGLYYRQFVSSKRALAINGIERGVVRATLDNSKKEVMEFREELHRFLAINEGVTEPEKFELAVKGYSEFKLRRILMPLDKNGLAVYCIFGGTFGRSPYTSIVVWTKENLNGKTNFVSVEFGRNNNFLQKTINEISAFAQLQRNNHLDMTT